MSNTEDILNVNKLVDKVKSTKKGGSDRYNRIKEILESRKKNRESWTDEKKENYEQFLERLKTAHDNFVKAFKGKIVECAENILQKNLKSRKFKIWNPQNIACELNNFAEYTIYRGFWNAEKKKHDRLPHMEAGIKSTPLNQVINELRPLGYKVMDVTDSKKSLNVVIEVLLEEKSDEVKEELEVEDLGEEVNDDVEIAEAKDV